MPRLPRICPLGIPQYVIQRGNNRQVYFGSDQDMAVYVEWLFQYAQEFGVVIHAWVLMTNHVHLLVTPKWESGVSMMMQSLGHHIYTRNRSWYDCGFHFIGIKKSMIHTC